MGKTITKKSEEKILKKKQSQSENAACEQKKPLEN